MMGLSQDAPARIQRWTHGVGVCVFAAFVGFYLWANWSNEAIENIANFAGASLGGAIPAGFAAGVTRAVMRVRVGVA